MRAEALLDVELRLGRSTCVRLRSEPPLTLRRTGEGEVHQVGSGAGPIGGDHLVVRVRVGAGATLVLRSVAASIVLPGPTGLPSRCELHADVAEGGRLVVLPEPLILAGGADHEVRTHVTLASGASLCWRDETVLGRHGDNPGSLEHRLRIDRCGTPLLRSDLAIGPRWPDSTGVAGLDGARCIGTLVLVGEGVDGAHGCGAGEAGPGAPGRSAAMELGPDAMVVSAVGETAASVRAGLARPRLPAREGFVTT
jgi:urease accessory protein